MTGIQTIHRIAHGGRRRLALGLLLAAGVLLSGCRQGMYDQPKFQPLQENPMYPDGQASRPLPPETLPVSAGGENATLSAARVNGVLVENMPVKVTRALLDRGQSRFNIFCSPCHDRMGYGTGMVVRRGFRNPPSYHIDRLVNAPDGYFYEVMTEGYGTMYSYADRVAPADRWAITAYIRALEYSQRARKNDVPPGELKKLEQKKPEGGKP